MNHVRSIALCVCVVALSLFWGGATPLGVLLTRLGALLLVLLWALDRRSDSGLELFAKPLAALLLLAGLGLFQSAPLPRNLVEFLSPEHVTLADEAALALGREVPTTVALSLNPRASRQTALDLLVYALLAIAAFRAGRHGSRLAWLAGAVTLTAGLQIIAGLRPWLSGGVPRLRGTYANPDHLCIVLEIAVCVAFGAAFWALSTRRFRVRPALRAAVTTVAGASGLLLLSAISFTGSRAGILAVLVGLAAQALALSRKSKSRWVPVATTAAAALAAAGFLAWIGISRSFGRMLGTSWFEVAQGERMVVWLQSLKLLGRFPFMGSGLGTFESAFPLAQGASLEGTRWAKAHNGYLELMATGGVVGGAIATAGAVWLLLLLTRKLRAAVRTDHRAALGVALGSIASVATHEFFDFGLSLPANAFLLVSIVAVAAGVRNGVSENLDRCESGPSAGDRSYFEELKAAARGAGHGQRSA